MTQIFEGITPEPCKPELKPVVVQCLAENLFTAMKKVQITKEHSLPVLNYVRLSIVDGCIELTATDLETINQATCGCKEQDSLTGAYRWSTCVPMTRKYQPYDPAKSKTNWRKGYPFLDYLKVIKDFDPLLTLIFDPDIQFLTIKQRDSTTVFKCIDAREFPPCKEVETDGQM